MYSGLAQARPELYLTGGSLPSTLYQFMAYFLPLSSTFSLAIFTNVQRILLKLATFEIFGDLQCITYMAYPGHPYL